MERNIRFTVNVALQVSSPYLFFAMTIKSPESASEQLRISNLYSPFSDVWLYFLSPSAIRIFWLLWYHVTSGVGCTVTATKEHLYF